MNKLFKKIGNIVLMGLLAVSLTGGMLYSIERKSTAEAAFYPVQTKSVRLYSGISSVSTSARLRSFYDLSGSTKLTRARFGRYSPAMCHATAWVTSGTQKCGIVGSMAGYSRLSIGSYSPF
jgi:hypothetical protein